MIPSIILLLGVSSSGSLTERTFTPCLRNRDL